MMNPLKLFLLILGTASLLSIAPYAISRLVPEPILASPAPVSGSAVLDAPPEVGTELPITVSAPSLDPEFAPSGGGKRAAKNRSDANEGTLDLPAPGSEAPKPTPVPSPTPIPYRVEVARAQEMLNQLGLDVGKVDGKRGQRTESALRQFQEKHGLNVSGDSDAATLARLQSQIAALATPTPAPAPVSVPSPTPAVILADVSDSQPVSAATGEAVTIVAAAAPVPVVSEPKATPAPTPAPAPAKPSPTADPQFVILTSEGKVNTPTPAAVQIADAEPEVAENQAESRVPDLPLPDFNPNRVPTLRNMKDVRLIQHALLAAGAYPEAPDGKWGKMTIAAMREFQEREDLDVTGKPNSRTWKRLVELAESNAKSSAAPDRPQKPEPEAVPVESTPAADVPKRLLSQVPPDQGKTEASVAALNANKAVVSAPAAPIVLPGVEQTEPIVVSKEKLTVAAHAPESAKAGPSAPLPISTPGVPEDPESAPAVETAKAEIPPVAAPAEEAPVSPPDPFAPREKTDLVAAAEPSVEASVDAGLPAPAETASTEAGPAPAESAAQTPLAEAPVVSPKDSIATPAAVSRHAVESVTNLPAPDETAAGSKGEELVPSLSASGRIIAAPDPVAVPQNAPAGLAAAPDPVPSTKVSLPPSKADLREAERAKELEKKIAETKAAVDAAGADTKLELARYAPENMSAASRLLDEARKQLQGKGGKTNSAEAEKALQAVDKELEQARTASLKAQADSKVSMVEAAYKAVKDRFSDQIRRNSELAETMTKIDGGYEAMKADLKKGNYEPIVSLCDGFKLSIDQLAALAAKEYLEAELKKSSVKSRLKKEKETAAKISALQKKEQHLEAADLLEGVLKEKDEKSSSADAKKSGSTGSRSRRR